MVPALSITFEATQVQLSFHSTVNRIEVFLWKLLGSYQTAHNGLELIMIPHISPWCSQEPQTCNLMEAFHGDSYTIYFSEQSFILHISIRIQDEAGECFKKNWFT